jgi:RNA polymerase sigma-70 factor, ECF subfamily
VDDPSRRPTRSNDGMKLLEETQVTAESMIDEPVAAAQAGNVAAFERLYHAHVGRVYALCLRLTADVSTAEELTQDVFVRAWEKLAGFRGESAFGTWLHRLAVNVVLGRRRSEGRRGARILLTQDLAIYEGIGARSPAYGDRLDLEDALARLPEATRSVFVLHEVEGYTHQEIAELTGRAEGTCKALLHRARRLLKERLL